MHPDLVGKRRVGLDGLGMDVLEVLKPTLAVRCLKHRDLGMVAVKTHGGIRPLAADRVPADDGEAEVGEERERCFDVADGDSDILESDGHALNVPSGARLLCGRFRRDSPGLTLSWLARHRP